MLLMKVGYALLILSLVKTLSQWKPYHDDLRMILEGGITKWVFNTTFTDDMKEKYRVLMNQIEILKILFHPFQEMVMVRTSYLSKIFYNSNIFIMFDKIIYQIVSDTFYP